MHPWLGVRCYVHHVDEPRPAWRVCFECNHAYSSPRELRHEYRRAYWQATGANEYGPADALWRRLWRVLTIRTSQIHFCQHCIHDW